MKPTHTFIRVPVSYTEGGDRSCDDCPMLTYDREDGYSCHMIDDGFIVFNTGYDSLKPHRNCPIDKVLNENDD